MKKIKEIHNFLRDRERVGDELYWIKKCWHIILIIFSSIYVLENQKLQKQGIIKRVGADFGGHWEILIDSIK